MTRTELVELIERPAETLAVEVKQWLRRDDPIEGAKIARALMALRNFDGGVLIIGLDDTTYVAAGGDRPAELRETYHPDKIQALVGKFARSPFEAERPLHPERRDGHSRRCRAGRNYLAGYVPINHSGAKWPDRSGAKRDLHALPC